MSATDEPLCSEMGSKTLKTLFNSSGLGTLGEAVWVRSDTSGGETATFTLDAEL